MYNNTQNNAAVTLRARAASLTFNTNVSDDVIANEIDQWNALLSVNYPGVGYYEEFPTMNQIAGVWNLKFALIADDAFWESFSSQEFRPVESSDNVTSLADITDEKRLAV